MQHLPKISLIATTYNRPDALRLCIESIGRQTLVPFEVIIADDGSTDDTRTLIERMRKDFPCPIVHAWQEDLGFRAAEVRNNALRLCKGDYVVFIDGDIIMHPHFVEDHAKMAQPNIVLNKIGKKEKEVVTKAENNYLSSECSNSTTSYGKINTICANNLASAQRKNQVHHKKIGGR